MNTTKKTILQKGKGKTRKQAKLEYLYEKESLYFAQIAESVKDIAIKELRNLGAYDLKPVFRGIWFKATKKIFTGLHISQDLFQGSWHPLFPLNAMTRMTCIRRPGK